MQHLNIQSYDSEYFQKIKVQSSPVSNSSNPTETAVYRSVLSPQELVKNFPQGILFTKKVKTIQELFEKVSQTFADRPFLGTRYPIKESNGSIIWSDYKFRTYAQVDQDRLWFGAGLIDLYENVLNGKARASKWFLGICSQNRYEWMVADLGAGGIYF